MNLNLLVSIKIMQIDKIILDAKKELSQKDYNKFLSDVNKLIKRRLLQ
tara:strand:- start:1223 stop:1366 length:144 start_codon:yes stop_codon:yes gene_type:complete